MSETVLVGGDVNVGENAVVRVGDTVRRPVGPHTPAIHALLRHFETVGFAGAPRVLGIDEKGREVLSYVAGDPGLAPLPAGDEVLADLGRQLRRMHDAQVGFAPDPDAVWFAPAEGAVICHHDLFPPNVIFRGGVLIALVDWDLARPGRLDDVVSAASHWAPLRVDGCEWGLPEGRHGERVRVLCDAYGLSAAERGGFVERALEHRRNGYELHRQLGSVERLPGWREMWDTGSGDLIRANGRWVEEHRTELESWLD